MKKLLVIAAMAAGFVAVAPHVIAQDQSKDKPAAAAPDAAKQGRGQRAGQGALQGIIQQLNLTDDQKAQVKPILEDLKHAMEEARNLQPPERGQKMREALQTAREKLNPILTEEQRTKLKELTAQATDPAARLQAALKNLNLTDDQKAKIKDVVDKYRPQFGEIMKSAAGDRQAAMQQIRPLLQEMRDNITAILTPEQAQKFRDSIGGGRGGAGGAGRPGGRQRQAGGGNA